MAAKPTSRSPKEHVECATLSAWRRWLSDHHQRPEGVWLVVFKQSSGKARLRLDEAVEEALCHGWIDSLPGKVDAERTKLYFAPRKPGTGWSRLNKQRVQRMLETGRMTKAGLAKIEAAKADGSWNKLDAIENLEVPDDLGRALKAVPGARVFFDAFPPSARRGILEWIAQARTPETRARRVEETARQAGNNERANAWRPATRSASTSRSR
jgi:uncharacterized protein YdeI (YjbR/CyaY-like superfamily)